MLARPARPGALLQGHRNTAAQPLQETARLSPKLSKHLAWEPAVHPPPPPRVFTEKKPKQTSLHGPAGSAQLMAVGCRCWHGGGTGVRVGLLGCTLRHAQGASAHTGYTTIKFQTGHRTCENSGVPHHPLHTGPSVPIQKLHCFSFRTPLLLVILGFSSIALSTGVPTGPECICARNGCRVHQPT